MAVSRAMRRLIEVRVLEEELSQAALESAVEELRRMEAALAAAQERERNGRRQVTASASTGELIDRIAGLEETRAAARHSAALKPGIAEAELEVARRRQQFLAKRIERRQVETLIQKTEAKDAVHVGRRAQRDLDDWFLSRARHGADRNERAREKEESPQRRSSSVATAVDSGLRAKGGEPRALSDDT
jgi:flagellar export protein FliJ